MRYGQGSRRHKHLLLLYLPFTSSRAVGTSSCLLVGWSSLTRKYLLLRHEQRKRNAATLMLAGDRQMQVGRQQTSSIGGRRTQEVENAAQKRSTSHSPAAVLPQASDAAAVDPVLALLNSEKLPSELADGGDGSLSLSLSLSLLSMCRWKCQLMVC